MITINNELGFIPRVTFSEQVVVEAAGEVFSKEVGALDIHVDEYTANETFPLLGADGEDTGEVLTVGQVAAMLTSAYVHFATKRDIAATAPPPEYDPVGDDDIEPDPPVDDPEPTDPVVH